MRNRLIVAVVVITAISFIQFHWHYGPWTNLDTSSFASSNDNAGPPEPVHTGVTVTADGKLDRILTDNSDGEHDQQFTLRLSSGITVLVLHNIDVASRIPDLKPGETIRIHGEYEWNDKGGTVRSTHRDPSGKFDAGWIEYNGQRYD